MLCLRKIFTSFLYIHLKNLLMLGVYLRLIWARGYDSNLLLTHVSYDTHGSLALHGEASPPFQLQEDTLKTIKSLPSPIVIVSAIGNARLGKSTALNCMYYSMAKQSGTFKEVFKTGDSQSPETRGVWIKILPAQGQNNKSIIFLDVEGTNAGDKSVIDNLSIFTGLLSSEIMAFTGKYVENHIVEFFYRVSKLLDMVTEYKQIISLPSLRVVQIGALKTPGKTQRDHVADALTRPFHRDNYDEQRKSIAKYFSWEKIQASELVYLPSENLHILESFHLHQDSLYANQIQVLVKETMALPGKQTLGGGVLDGDTFVDIARKLVAAMNTNFWKDFGNQYKEIEGQACEKAANRLFGDLDEKSVDEIEEIKDERISEFEKKCALHEKREWWRKQIKKVLRAKEETERKEAELEQHRKEQICDKAANRLFGDLEEKSVHEIEEIKDKRITQFEVECTLQEKREWWRKQIKKILRAKLETERKEAECEQHRKEAEWKLNQCMVRQQTGDWNIKQIVTGIVGGLVIGWLLGCYWAIVIGWLLGCYWAMRKKYVPHHAKKKCK